MDGLRVLAGGLTGVIVGLTGVGGGALMTPVLLLFFGTAPLTAVGTDLWFAAITKIAITSVHQRRSLIDWQIVRRLWIGSLTTSALTLIWLHYAPAGRSAAVLTTIIGVAVCVSAIGLLAQKRLHALANQLDVQASGSMRRWQPVATTLAGAVLGVLVTLTSVGAGALGTLCLLYLYPSRLSPPRLIATDVAHAIPLAMFAGLGHLLVGSVDFALLRDLLAGSLPGALIGALVAARLPHAWLRLSLAAVLLLVGAKLLISI
jgi:uncharacterized membrane protein YfcA